VVVSACDLAVSRTFRNQAAAQVVEVFVLPKHHDVFAHGMRLI